ncbi:MAG: envelope stress response membrane protein PspB [Caenispirillum bisanense]|uniref:Phage shock protein B n=1 Tax=Caenispirillum bisanense TaxID=414052 RepID=A0A286GX16_9PROT|nr:envelope stress response membrane protein PspB [Caenispirillum bisanense]MCA1941934.1 envelope stress response membrane protein PspB [Caenispirillum bisanense]MCA1975292.1 envelope stress response membrane protein PspB [Caenispirillum sp.]SOE00078.1 phage shock protein B [Caenispirillum bisanense]
MEFVVFVLGFLALAVVAPIAIIGHTIVRWRAIRTLSAEEERTMADLLGTADRLRERVINLERILDAEVPGWRTEP